MTDTAVRLPAIDDHPGESSDEVRPLTRAEAQQLSTRLSMANPFASSWPMLAGQALAGGLVAVLGWALTGRAEVGWSALYGALAAVVPAAVFARGVAGGFMRGRAGRMSPRPPAAALASLFVWEAVKIILAVAMLFAAPKVVASLSWLALVAGFVVAMKMIWVPLLLSRGRERAVKA